MKKLCMAALAALILGLPACGSSKEAAPTLDVKTREDKISYGIGMDIAGNLQSFPFKLNPDLVAQGIKDSLSGAKPLVADKDLQEAMQSMQTEMMAKQAMENEKMKTVGEQNKADGAKFLEENKKKEGVVTTKSGLQYKVITKGSGPKPKPEDVVMVHYRGALINGTEFDSSYARNQPAKFPVGGVIPGFAEALQLMEVGSKFQVVIPSELAYGDKQAGPNIAPNSVLVFDLELTEITGEKEPSLAAEPAVKPAAKPEVKKDAAKAEAKAEKKK